MWQPLCHHWVGNPDSADFPARSAPSIRDLASALASSGEHEICAVPTGVPTAPERSASNNRTPIVPRNIATVYPARGCKMTPFSSFFQSSIAIACSIFLADLAATCGLAALRIYFLSNTSLRLPPRIKLIQPPRHKRTCAIRTERCSHFIPVIHKLQPNRRASAASDALLSVSPRPGFQAERIGGMSVPSTRTLTSRNDKKSCF